MQLNRLSAAFAMSAAIFVTAAIFATTGSAAYAAPRTTVRNIVLVHGAWVDGSGWKRVYEILAADGFNVTLVQEPLSSLADDVSATRRTIALQTGPVILVSHSYG